jgi:hypothetical protein
MSFFVHVQSSAGMDTKPATPTTPQYEFFAIITLHHKKRNLHKNFLKKDIILNLGFYYRKVPTNGGTSGLPISSVGSGKETHVGAGHFAYDYVFGDGNGVLTRRLS